MSEIFDQIRWGYVCARNAAIDAKRRKEAAERRASKEHAKLLVHADAILARAQWFALYATLVPNACLDALNAVVVCGEAHMVYAYRVGISRTNCDQRIRRARVQLAAIDMPDRVRALISRGMHKNKSDV